MTCWSRQTGFPLVTVEENKQVSATKRQLVLSQKRHLDDGGEDEEKTLWNIPISIISKSSPQKILSSFVMKQRRETAEVKKH